MSCRRRRVAKIEFSTTMAFRAAGGPEIERERELRDTTMSQAGLRALAMVVF